MFDVYVDESVIYSNRREGGRLPKNDEIIQRIRDYQASPLRRQGSPVGDEESTSRRRRVSGSRRRRLRLRLRVVSVSRS